MHAREAAAKPRRQAARRSEAASKQRGAHAAIATDGQDHRVPGARAHPGSDGAARRSASRHYREFILALDDDAAAKQGARCMDCGIPFCQTRLPGQQHHSGLERPRLPAPVAQRARRAALDQQLSRVHRPRLPGAVRSGVHAQHQRRPGRHQVDRALHHRQGLGGRLGRAAAAASEDRQARRGGRLRARGHGVRAAARARGPRRRAVREGRSHRRPAALRHPRLQDGEAPDRPAHGADGGRGRRSSARTSHVGGDVAAAVDCSRSSTRSC